MSLSFWPSSDQKRELVWAATSSGRDALGTSAWAWRWNAGRPPWAPLWPPSARAFKDHRLWALDQLGLAKMKVTLAGLRAGGATQLFKEGMDVNRIRFEGSWVSDKNLACYIQEALVAQVWRSCNRPAVESLHALVKHHATLLSSALKRPRHQLVVP